MKRFLGSALLGYAGLAAVQFTAQYTGVLLPISRLSLGVSGLLGLPGVVLMLLLNLIL